MRKITHTMLCRPYWDNVALEYCPVNVFQIRLRQHGTRKLFVQGWPRAHRYVFAGKTVVVSNMSGSLFFNRIQYHQTILALFVQCCFGSSFTACGTTMNRGRHWLEHKHVWIELKLDLQDCWSWDIAIFKSLQQKYVAKVLWWH